MPSAATVRLCAGLWEQTGDGDRFPRTLEPLCTWTLRLAVIPVSILWSTDVRRRLAEYGIAAATGPRRRLRACLVIRDGQGAVFLDGADPPDERRFSLAHEAAHFVLESVLPRRRLASRLGPASLAAYDGRRTATTEERIDAVLAGVDLQPRLHLMERDASGLACGSVAGAECAADELAIELIAPEAAVLARLQTLSDGFSYEGRCDALAVSLTSEFGLPASVAGLYARSLCRAAFGGPSIAEWLGLTTLPLRELGEGRGEGASTGEGSGMKGDPHG